MAKHFIAAPVKVYCVEKNEIYPSINFAFRRVTENIYSAIDNGKDINGFHYRRALPDDIANGTEVGEAEYPNIINTKKKAAKKPELKKTWQDCDIERLGRARQLASSITGYLNDLENIFTVPKGEQEKLDSFSMAALYVGKLMISFCDLCDNQKIFEEVDDLKVRKKLDEDKEKDFEYEEVV